MGGAVGRTGTGGAGTGGVSGFSLIELLVVIAILSVLAMGVVFSVGRDGENGDLQRFRNAYTLQRDLAIEGREMRGLKIGPRDMQVMVWRPGAGQELAGWQVMGDKARWRGQVAYSAPTLMPPGGPEIVFLPDGQGTGFSVQFDGGARCESDGWSELSCG